MVGYIFGGDGMPKTPQELEQMREVARSLGRHRGSPQNVGEGIASIGDAILYRAMNNRADKAQKAGEDSVLGDFNGLTDSLFAPQTTADVPPVDTSAVAPTIASPQDAVDASPQKPLTGDLAAQEAYIRQAAQQRGINPDYAVKVARSEGLAPGVWQSRVKKGDQYEPSYGPFQMLVGDGKTFPKGMGNDFMEKTGLDPRDPKNVNQMIDFALDTAKRDGWRQWYGAKAVGVNRWDGINQNQVASLDPSIPAGTTDKVPVVPVPDGFQQADPMAQQPVQVADSSGVTPRKRVAQALGDTETTRRALNVLNNPFANPGQRAVAQALLKRHFDEQDRIATEEAKRNDPKYQLDLRKGRIELENLEHPKIGPADQARLDFDRQKMEADQTNRTTLSASEQAKLDLDKQKFEWEKEKQPETIQKYKFYEDREKAAGRLPLGPLEWEQALRSSSASKNQVNIDQKTEGAFDKKLAEKQAETFSTMAEEGINARADVDIINQLDEFTKGQGGAMTGLASMAASWGIPVKGGDDLTAAKALINKLVPTQRQPGSGSMSDRDVELFSSSLPSLWNQPGGNEKIIGVMRGLATYKQQQGEIADQVIMGEMTRQEARRALRELPNPLAEFRKQEKAKKTKIGDYEIEEVE